MLVHSTPLLLPHLGPPFSVKDIFREEAAAAAASQQTMVRGNSMHGCARFNGVNNSCMPLLLMNIKPFHHVLFPLHHRVIHTHPPYPHTNARMVLRSTFPLLCIQNIFIFCSINWKICSTFLKKATKRALKSTDTLAHSAARHKKVPTTATQHIQTILFLSNERARVDVEWSGERGKEKVLRGEWFVCVGIWYLKAI
jgi:hypothetical protein